VLGAAVRSTLGQPAIKVRAPSPLLASSHSRQPAAARPLSAATADKPFDDWFLRSLLALMGIAAAGVLLAVLFERDGAGEAVTALRSRIGSRGLSATRIALRARARQPDDIHYRE
jgi:predicted lipid-binding transport protein (Tim44 family)